MPDDIEAVAMALADSYYREKEQRKVKWGHMAPSDRSLWRLMARIAAQELADVPAAGSQPKKSHLTLVGPQSR